MIKQHIVKDSDSLQYLAKLYYGKPDDWAKIATYNKLDYPYLTADASFQTEIFASGLVTFYVSTIRGYDTPIPAGTIVTTNKNDRKYRTNNAAVLPAGAVSIAVAVTCTVAGFWGNISAGAIVSLDTSTPISGISVTNGLAFFNGMVYNVKKTGDTLLIPFDEDSVISDTIGSTADYLELLGGEDILLDDEGDVTSDAYGDLTSISGLKNMEYACKHRLETPKGSLPRHPGYGSKLHQLAGRREPFISKLIELDIIETLLQDHRIESVVIRSITKVGLARIVDCDIRPVGIQNAQRMRLPLSI